MTVVFGKARAIVDDNRVRIPAKFYKLLGDDFLIAPGKGGCILMIPNESYQTVIGSYLEKTQYGESEEQRNLRNGMDSVSLDQQSRLTFSGEMKDMCPGLDGAPEIVFSGGGEFVAVGFVGSVGFVGFTTSPLGGLTGFSKRPSLLPF